MPGGNGSDNILKLAIDQYEQIVKLDPDERRRSSAARPPVPPEQRSAKSGRRTQTAIKLDPSSEEAVTTLAMLYTDEGDTAHALKVLSSIPDSARSAKLYSALGAAYEQRKDYKSAIDAYKHAIVLDRDNLDAIRGLAENLMNDGQLEAALEQYKVIADSNPEDAQTYVRIAEIYRRQGKYDQALENLKRADTLVPDTMDVPYSMAAVYQAQGRYDEAIKILQDLMKKTEKSETGTSQADRNNRAIFIERLGMVYREQENYTAAVDTFRKMLTLGDENARSGYQEIIDTYREAKQWPQATAAAKEAVQKMPDDRDLRMVLDAQLADTGEFDQAVADMRSHAEGRPRGSRSLCAPGHHLHPRQALERRRAGSRQGRAALHQGRRQSIRVLPARRPLPAAEEIRSGRSGIQESAGVDSPTDPQSCRHAELSRLHERRSRREAGRVAQPDQAGAHA